MKSINPIQDSEGEKYLIVDPYLCMEQCERVQYENMIQCKYCKSINVCRIKKNQSQCQICKCLTDVKYNNSINNISQLVTSNIIVTSLPQATTNYNNKDSSTLNNYKHKHNNKIIQNINNNNKYSDSDRMRLLIVYQSKLGEQYSNGMLCLKQILPQYTGMEICLVMYDTQVRLVQLQQDGRIIIMNKHSLQLINDQFYPITPTHTHTQQQQQCQMSNQPASTVQYLLQVIQSDSWHKSQTTLNATKIMVQILQSIRHIPTIVLWIGNINQNMQLYSYPSYPHIDIYSILKIPYTVNSHSQMEALNSLSKYSTRTKYILKNDTKTAITSKIHYQLYQIFWNQTICAMRVQASRQRKYPPQILTTKQTIIGSLRNCVIVKLGKTIQNGETIQVRIRYRQFQNIQEKQQKQQKLNQQQQLSKQQESTRLISNTNRQSRAQTANKSRNKILIINCTFPPSSPQPNLFLYRYLQLFKFVKINPTNLQLRSMPIKNNIDIDICQYFRECSYLNKQALYTNIENPNCVYAIWPWIGTKQLTNRKQVQFVYYFIGFCLGQFVWRAYLNRQRQTYQNQQQYEDLPYKKQIDELNQLCQILYCPFDKNMIHYYQSMIEDLLPGHLQLSDGESDDREEDNKYYQYKIKDY